MKMHRMLLFALLATGVLSAGELSAREIASSAGQNSGGGGIQYADPTPKAAGEKPDTNAGVEAPSSAAGQVVDSTGAISQATLPTESYTFSSASDRQRGEATYLDNIDDSTRPEDVVIGNPKWAWDPWVLGSCNASRPSCGSTRHGTITDTREVYCNLRNSKGSVSKTSDESHCFNVYGEDSRPDHERIRSCRRVASAADEETGKCSVTLIVQPPPKEPKQPCCDPDDPDEPDEPEKPWEVDPDPTDELWIEGERYFELKITHSWKEDDSDDVIYQVVCTADCEGVNTDNVYIHVSYKGKRRSRALSYSNSRISTAIDLIPGVAWRNDDGCHKNCGIYHTTWRIPATYKEVPPVDDVEDTDSCVNHPAPCKETEYTLGSSFFTLIENHNTGEVSYNAVWDGELLAEGTNRPSGNFCKRDGFLYCVDMNKKPEDSEIIEKMIPFSGGKYEELSYSYYPITRSK